MDSIKNGYNYLHFVETFQLSSKSLEGFIEYSVTLVKRSFQLFNLITIISSMASSSFRSILFSTSVVCITFLLTPAHSQNVVLDTLQSQINTLKKNQAQHRDKQFSHFIDDVTMAAASPEAAQTLIAQSIQNLADAQAAALAAANPDGSAPPSPAPHRRKWEEQQNQNQSNTTDQAKLDAKGLMAQAHCGLLRFSALLAKTPDAPHLKEDWMAWLSSAAQNYPALGNDSLGDKSMRDSPVTKSYEIDYGDKEQGDWTIRKLPDLFESNVLKPLGEAKDPKVLDAWETYMNMIKFDEQSDLNKWNTITCPSLTFKKKVAAYKLRPDVMKLQDLYNFAQQLQNHPEFNSMLDQITTFLNQMKGSPAQATTATH